MDHHPMGEVRGQAQLWNRFQIIASLNGRVRGSATMCFDQNGNAAALTQLRYTLEDPNVLREAKNIAAGMTIDKRNLTLRGKFKLRFETLDMILVGLPLG